MNSEYHKWYSDNLHRDMELKVYGHAGQPYIVFPTSRGRFFDYENMGMVGAISSFIEKGKIKLFSVDSVDAETWYNLSILPGDRNARYEDYDRYIIKEVIPFVREHCHLPEERIMATGCSMGAYHSVNLFLKHPDLFAGVIGLSGLYRLDQPEFHLPSAELQYVYHNSPIAYLKNQVDPSYLEWYRKSTIIVCTGQGKWENEAVHDTRELEAQFKEKDIPAWFDYWGYDVNHDWPWWYKQMNYFLDHLYK